MERGRRQKVNTLGLNEIKHFISHIWLGIFVVCNFRYWEIVDILFIVRLQIKKHVRMFVCMAMANGDVALDGVAFSRLD